MCTENNSQHPQHQHDHTPPSPMSSTWRAFLASIAYCTWHWLLYDAGVNWIDVIRSIVEGMLK